ncbi:MAG: hypothetical protein HYW25_01120 [Candidatus Aenigmarchaeota archaeon]|nr:hypothetical protein [Candidatus Aenigmarchaeota archaeon]
MPRTLKLQWGRHLLPLAGRLQVAIGRRSNWHHGEDSNWVSIASIYARCLNVNLLKVLDFQQSADANYGRWNAKSFQNDANSNDGFRQ